MHGGSIESNSAVNCIQADLSRQEIDWKRVIRQYQPVEASRTAMLLYAHSGD